MARQLARTHALAAVLIVASAPLASAQPRMQRGPNPDAPKLMVSACQIFDKVLATMCADKIRSQIEGDVSFRSLLVIPKGDVENTLSASGYDPATHLTPLDASALAKQVHADFYVDASLEKSGANYKVNASVVLSRDANMRQPIGTYEHAKFETVAEQVSRGFQDAFNKTFDHQKDCFTDERERKYDEALKQANEGLRDYPQSLWLRHCKLAVLKDQKAPGDQVAALLEEIVKLDPGNKAALRDLIVIYETNGDKKKKIATLFELRTADPTDPKLTAQIVNSLAEEGLLDQARQVVELAIAQNAGDINLIRPYWLILMNSATRHRTRVDSAKDDAQKKAYGDSASREYKKALDVGQQMATMDTSTADTSYFFRMISAANADSNFTLGAQLADKGAVKFPKVKDFNNFAVALWRKAGDNAKSVAAAERAMKNDPTAMNMRAPIAFAYLSEKPPKIDEAIAMAREMITAGEDKNQIAAIAVQSGNLMLSAANAAKAAGADPATAQASTEKVYATLTWADSLAQGTTVAAQGKFLLGYAALGMGQIYLTQAGDLSKKVQEDYKAASTNEAKKKVLDDAYPRICAVTNKADEYFTIATGAVPSGAKFDPKSAQTVMGQVMQMNGYVDQYKKIYCKKP